MSKTLTSVKLILIFTMVIVASPLLWAWPPTYGAEFELTKTSLRPSFNDEGAPDLTHENRMKDEMAEYIRSVLCTNGRCSVEFVDGKWGLDHKVKFSDGWWFKVSSDPGCVEVTFKPSTLEILENKRHIINEYIFSAGKSVGLKPTKTENTHFNMGIRSAFNDSGTDFLKFFVDYANHPDLALGSLGYDLYNAPTLSVMNQSQREALKEIVERNANGELMSISDIAREIEVKVYTHVYEPSWGGENHYQAVGLKYVNQTDLNRQDAPMELRGVWSQTSAENFNLVAKLIQGRIQYLKRNPTPIVYHAPVQKEFSASELKTRFYIYVEEAGLKYENFESLLPDSVRRATFEPILNPKATYAQKLKDIESYWPDMTTSEWVRNRIIDILSDAKGKNHPVVENYLKKIQDASEKSLISKTNPDFKEPIIIKKNLLQTFYSRVLKYLGLTPKEVHAWVGSNSVLDWNALVFKSIDKTIKTRANVKSEVLGVAPVKSKIAPVCRDLF